MVHLSAACPIRAGRAQVYLAQLQEYLIEHGLDTDPTECLRLNAEYVAEKVEKYMTERDTPHAA